MDTVEIVVVTVSEAPGDRLPDRRSRGDRVIGGIAARNGRAVQRAFPLRPAEPDDPALRAIEAEQDRYLTLSADPAEVEGLLADLRGQPDVAGAYAMPAIELPIAPGDAPRALRADPPIGLPGPPPAVPDLRGEQSWLGAPPGGIGVAAAHALAGGDGSGVRLIDVEAGWTLDHVDLAGNGGLAFGVNSANPDVRAHGTAVLAQVCGTAGPPGVSGAAPGVAATAVAHNTAQGSAAATAIDRASDRLRRGDILLIEMQAPGPGVAFQSSAAQTGYIAVEWWPHILVAVKRAVARGVIVVAAAGNGGQDLDAAALSAPAQGFPASWRNPFGADDSGAILVGAGRAGGTARMAFSNFGARIDCQGPGERIVTAGYGDRFADPANRGDERVHYTARFGGTSGAAPAVAGAAACLQGIARARGAVLTPAQMRAALRAHGTPQAGGFGAPQGHIGPRPDLGRLIAALFGGTA